MNKKRTGHNNGYKCIAAQSQRIKPPWIINIYKYKLQIGNNKVKKNKLND